ncbi:MAG: endonuclease [Sciscionella sp.]|nr:endonuclease [Sciscionella sp.]
MTDNATVRDLLDRYGQTFADQAGITLRDKPAPLYQLLVLTTLLSVRITSDIAVAAARELFRSIGRTPKAMLESDWQQRVDALGRANYVRYDESTATYLRDGAELVLDKYRGDLRNMGNDANYRPAELRKRLREFPRIGDNGAHIFCREVQAVWPRLRPYFDDFTIDSAKMLGLPADSGRLAEHVAGDELAVLTAALVRAKLDKKHRKR